MIFIPYAIREKRRKRRLKLLQALVWTLVLIYMVFILPGEKRLKPISQRQQSEVVARWGDR